jgi:maltose O-acetyltransferase
MKCIYKLLYFIKYNKIFNGSLRNISIDKNIFFESKNLVDFGKGIYLGRNFYVMNKGKLTIGDNVIFAPNVSIIDYNHNFESVTHIPYDGHDIIKPVTIEQDCWIGFGAIILPGTYIEKGVIVGAGSIVKGRLESNYVYAGNPIQKIKPRKYSDNQKQYMIEKLGLK